MLTETLKYARGNRKAGNKSPALTEDADIAFSSDKKKVFETSDSYAKPCLLTPINICE